MTETEMRIRLARFEEREALLTSVVIGAVLGLAILMVVRFWPW